VLKALFNFSQPAESARVRSNLIATSVRGYMVMNTVNTLM